MVKRTKEAGFGLRDVTPMPWVQVSGDLEADARYVVKLATRAQRLHEMRRLKHFHGQKYADQVGERVVELWPRRQEIISMDGQAANDAMAQMEAVA